MLGSDQVEELICVLATWDRPMLARHFKTFASSFPIDFTPEFLEQLTVDRLRHVFLAMCLQNKRMPEYDAMAA